MTDLRQSPRPFEEQTFLERVLRSRLWHPLHDLKKNEEHLPKAIRAKDWSAAAQCERRIRECKGEVEKWLDLLGLYEAERQGITHGRLPEDEDVELDFD